MSPARGRPAGRTAIEDRWARRRATYVTRRGRATTPAGRLMAAADYLRGALGDVPPGQAHKVGGDAAAHLAYLAEMLRREQIGRE
ncbi:hypothetical protein [Pseudofrankia asymbiotica]|uniref:Uncharacterized protein n=1 Tax=Pseudofrankia asymbiotica TaxID=1834516 RepID=A0A1V2I1T3_9ACTN|nr:hypothetical protein [Pseudofrankia asymbiotica]ONH23825.1 hypothetical protein BL253_31910 [Pseudofrankia asymbiotica]